MVPWLLHLVATSVVVGMKFHLLSSFIYGSAKCGEGGILRAEC